MSNKTKKKSIIYGRAVGRCRGCGVLIINAHTSHNEECSMKKCEGCGLWHAEPLHEACNLRSR